MTVKIEEGCYFKTEGLTQEQYEFLVGKFLELGASNNFKHGKDNHLWWGWEAIAWSANFGDITGHSLHSLHSLNKYAREIKLTDFKEYRMNNTVEFPDYDFKLDCGDDPRVRQWLRDNGCGLELDTMINGNKGVTIKYLYVRPNSNCPIGWDLDYDWKKTCTELPIVTPVFTLTDLIVEKPIDNDLKDELKLLEEQQREIAEKMKELQEKIGK